MSQYYRLQWGTFVSLVLYLPRPYTCGALPANRLALPREAGGSWREIADITLEEM